MYMLVQQFIWISMNREYMDVPLQHYTWMNYYTHIQECAITEAHMDILLQKDSAIIQWPSNY